MTAHFCHARNCTVRCKPEFLMCGRHWGLVPAKLQRAVWATYRSGQCDDKCPSEEWHEAADAAIAAVALREGCPSGKLSVNQVRAVLVLAPELFGADEAKMRRGLQVLDRKKKSVASLAERKRKRT
jgi:hypothetical protein